VGRFLVQGKIKWAEKTPCKAPISGSEGLVSVLLLAKSHAYYKLINRWVWLESQTYREWLQGHMWDVWD